MKIYHITGAMLSFTMEMTPLSPKNSSCYAIECKTVEEEKNIQVVLHSKAKIEGYTIYVATMIQEDTTTKECVILDATKQGDEKICLMLQ